MSLAKKLWAENEDLTQVALTHPFVQGLRTGNLPRETFQRYIAQDAFFLDAFARSYALSDGSAQGTTPTGHLLIRRVRIWAPFA